MDSLDELLKLGIHDAKIEMYLFDVTTSLIQFHIKVEDEVEDEKNINGIKFKNGILSFIDIQAFAIEGGFDFKNENIILEGNVDEKGCALYITSDQRIQVKCKSVSFEWKS